ncbi:hypothetical protein [Dactylosporangium sp. CS-033363]|uniref:hypothetical protein n=1 Tax=Dactylosporangium sp. CS-033363 TaxID=3239935 RepID=UPI003D8ADF40
MARDTASVDDPALRLEAHPDRAGAALRLVARALVALGRPAEAVAVGETAHGSDARPPGWAEPFVSGPPG